VRLVARVDQHVGRLQVAVDHAALMRVRTARRCGARARRRARYGRVAARAHVSRGWPSTSSIAYQGVCSAAPLANSVTRPGWSSREARLDLALEAAAFARRRSASSQGHLERDDALGRFLPCAVDDACPPRWISHSIA
jgi:hypothetical protein